MPYHSVGALRRVAFVCALSCTFHAAAGEVSLQGLNSSSTHQRFIVSYKNSVGSSRATGLSAPWGDIARAVPQVRGKRWACRPRAGSVAGRWCWWPTASWTAWIRKA